jgi:hypothetical protein
MDAPLAAGAAPSRVSIAGGDGRWPPLTGQAIHRVTLSMQPTTWLTRHWTMLFRPIVRRRRRLVRRAGFGVTTLPSARALADTLCESLLCGFHALRFREHGLGARFELHCGYFQRRCSLSECSIVHSGCCCDW